MPPFENNRLVVGSRKSGLALWQTEHVIERLQRAWPDVVLEIRPYVTEGDDNLETALPEIGGKGVFTRGSSRHSPRRRSTSRSTR